MSAIITATNTIMDGLVVRWRGSEHGPEVLSASRNAVMIHGDVRLEVIEPWLDDARRAHQALRAGRRDEAEALVTHQHSHPFRDDLVPVTREESTVPEGADHA